MDPSKPVGVILIGALLLGTGAISILSAILLASNALIIDSTGPEWTLLAGAVVGGVVSFGAVRVGLGLLRVRPIERRTGEVAMWLGIPLVLLLLAYLTVLLTEGQRDVVLWGMTAVAGVCWSGVLVGAALYMRSKKVREYFHRVGARDNPPW